MKPIDRHLLRWATDSYFALTRWGVDPEVAGRVIVNALIKRLDPTRKEPDMPKISDAFPSKWLRAEEIDEAGEILTIRRVQYEEVAHNEEKLICYFTKGDKGLVLNKTNASTIADLYGDDTDDWEGQSITLYPTEVLFNQKMVRAIRIRSRKPKAAAPAAAGKRNGKKVVTQQEADDLDDDEATDDIPF